MLRFLQPTWWKVFLLVFFLLPFLIVFFLGTDLGQNCGPKLVTDSMPQNVTSINAWETGKDLILMLNHGTNSFDFVCNPTPSSELARVIIVPLEQISLVVFLYILSCTAIYLLTHTQGKTGIKMNQKRVKKQ